MAYYLMALPAVYFGTQYAATQAMNSVGRWFMSRSDLYDDSEAVLAAGDSILETHASLSPSHSAYKAKTYLKQSIETLRYKSNSARRDARRWRVMRYDYTAVNSELVQHINQVEQRIRLFREVFMMSSRAARD